VDMNEIESQNPIRLTIRHLPLLR